MQQTKTDPSLYVVTPTYNERDNIREFARRIFALGLSNLTLVIVDDNSPDGTGAIAEELAQQLPIKVLHRPQKMGLGTAYMDAFRKVLIEHPDYIIQMDADLSHDPAIIPLFLKQMHDYDLVIGSRYINGGHIVNWSFARRIVSRCGNGYARRLLNLPYRDLTGGFKCWRRTTLEYIIRKPLSSVGYNFQIETTYLAHRKKFRICEVPITFIERKTGSSKMSFWIIAESFWKVLRLRRRG